MRTWYGISRRALILLKRAKSDVFADFHLDDTEIDTIKALAKDGKVRCSATMRGTGG